VAVYYIVEELVSSFASGALDGNRMAALGAFAAGGAMGAVLLNFAALMCSHVAAFETLYGLKLEFASHIASLPLGFHTSNSTGKLRKIVDGNIEKLEGFIAHQLPDLAGSFAMPAIALILLFVFDWRLGLASLIPIAGAYAVQTLAFGNRNAQEFIKKYQDSLEDMNASAVEYVRGITVVKAFNQTIFSFRKFHETIKAYGKFVLSYTLAFEPHMCAFMAIIGHVHIFIIPAVILLAGGAQSYSAFALSSVFYLIFSVSLATPFTKLMYVSQLSEQIADGITRMDKVLDTPPLPVAASPKTADGFTVSFEDVSFSYSEDEEISAVSGVSFTAAQGEVTALVGPSGGGKSTLAHLIPRFYDVSSGAISIGGVDIREMDPSYLMSIVSFVFQDIFLFKQSIADNILVGKKGASSEEMLAAAKAAQCHEFVKKLPNGYDTVIGANSIHLSGGERQRIAIARAILKNAPIIVLDEATAFSDPENESKIQLAFEELMKDKTVIIIAHRLSTVRGADKIVVIDEGKVAETGTHGALRDSSGRYSRMWASYASAMNWTLSGKEKKNA
jgi:ATP-binding cassette subfamily B protein